MTSKMTSKIVIIDDEPIALKRLRRILEKEGHPVAAFTNPQRALEQIEKEPCALVISDVCMPGMNGLDLMTRVKGRFPNTETILITGYASIDGAVEATREGAFHYLQKPFTPDQLRQVVDRALAQRRIKDKIAPLSDPVRSGAPVIIGESPKIREVVSVIDQIAPTDCHVLITGDSGTGKELAARALHEGSPRARGPFVAFNCGALNENLLDNELFGHEKGAYTGADACSAGLLETASGGTIFLDEIGEMPQAMQVKLLRVLQENELIRVGGRTPVPIDVRVVSATAKDLRMEVNAGAFRKDLFFRINVVNIRLPGLHERAEDIALLSYHILNHLNRRTGRKVNAISARAMSLLKGYTFPGNVRELENILERAVAVSHGDVIRVCDLPPDLIELDLQEYRRPESKMMTLEELEQDYIAHLLRITGGVRTKTAELLGIDRASLWRKMKKYDLA